MWRKVLKSKIHEAVVTATNLSYEGSITIDKNLLEKANILRYESILAINLSNGERFETYVLPGKEGEIVLNGGTARLGIIGDKLLILSFMWIQEAESYKPKIIFVDEQNRIREVRSE